MRRHVTNTNRKSLRRRQDKAIAFRELQYCFNFTQDLHLLIKLNFDMKVPSYAANPVKRQFSFRSLKSAILPSVIGNFDDHLQIGSSDWHLFFLLGMRLRLDNKKKRAVVYSVVTVCHIVCVVNPSYSLSDFLIESVSVRKQLEQESIRHEYEVASSTSPSFPPPSLPTKHQLISCLASRGHWVTTQPNLQLDPPDSQQLLMKGASLHFLFEPVWLLSGAHQGDFLHMLKNVLARLEDNTFK